MTAEGKEYLRNWLLLANEDIAAAENLFRSDPLFYARSIGLGLMKMPTSPAVVA